MRDKESCPKARVVKYRLRNRQLGESEGSFEVSCNGLVLWFDRRECEFVYRDTQEFVQGRKRERNGSGSEKNYRSRRTIVTVSEECQIACMHARGGRASDNR